MPARVPRRLSLAWILAAVGVLVAAELSAPRGVRAQIAPLTYELRLGSSVPVGDLREAGVSWAGELGADYSFGMAFAYAVRWYAAAYVGFSQHRFSCRISGCGRNTDLTATGFDGGVRWIFGSGRIIPVIRTGAVTYRMEGHAPDGSGGSQPVTSRRGVGLEGGVGISVRLSRRIVISPGVRYLWMDLRFPEQGMLPVRSVVVDVGFVLGF